MKKALITGITGQDGSYLAEHLLASGYDVHGLVRQAAMDDPSRCFYRIGHILDQLTLHAVSLESCPALFSVFGSQQFDECYHLAAAQSLSFADGFTTMNTNINGTHYILAALRELQPTCRFYFAGSSEMFGKALEVPQTEKTPFRPRSPYGISKVAAFDLTRNYREVYNMYCASGILFNHESSRRGHKFVTRKITSAVARIRLGLTDELHLGNLDARRDWGHAADYVRAMHLMLQQKEPDDYVIASGETHTVREFCECAFSSVGLDWQKYVKIDESLVRPAEVDFLVGDPTKVRTVLNWKPHYTFEQLIEEMVRNDIEAVAHG